MGASEAQRARIADLRLPLVSATNFSINYLAIIIIGFPVQMKPDIAIHCSQ